MKTWAEQSILDRMVTAVENVRERLRRATAALEAKGLPYAIVGGNAVAAWVDTVDSSAVRNTPDVDILVRRADLHSVTDALETVGFVRHDNGGVTVFLDGPSGRTREAIHIFLAGEKICPEYPTSAPEVLEAIVIQEMRVIALDPLVRMHLTAFRNVDAMLLRDLLDVGLIDSTWPARLPSELATRLQLLIDTPEG